MARVGPVAGRRAGPLELLGTLVKTPDVQSHAETSKAL